MTTNPPEGSEPSANPVFDEVAAGTGIDEDAVGGSRLPATYGSENPSGGARAVAPPPYDVGSSGSGSPDPSSGSSGASGASATAGAAKDEAKAVASDAKDAAGQVAGTAKDQASRVAGEAKNQVRDLYHTSRGELRDQAATQQKRVAGGIRSIGDELRSMAERSDQGGIASEVVRNVGNRAGSVAGFLDDRDPGSLIGEVRDFAARRPALFIAIAAGAGILAGRLTKGLIADAKSDDGSAA